MLTLTTTAILQLHRACVEMDARTVELDKDRLTNRPYTNIGFPDSETGRQLRLVLSDADDWALWGSHPLSDLRERVMRAQYPSS